jgi:hypothetical protein
MKEGEVAVVAVLAAGTEKVTGERVESGVVAAVESYQGILSAGVKEQEPFLESRSVGLAERRDAGQES